MYHNLLCLSFHLIQLIFGVWLTFNRRELSIPIRVVSMDELIVGADVTAFGCAVGGAIALKRCSIVDWC
jgi:hypothetical protein